MKKTIIKGLLAGCFTVGLAGPACGQLPSEKAFPLALSKEVKERIAQQPPAAAVLPSTGRKLPKGTALGQGQLPSSSVTPVVSVADRRKKLPSNARNPGVTIQRGRSN